MPPTFSLLHSTARTHGWQNACRIWRINADHPESCEYVLGIHARQNELPGNADVQFSDYLMFCGHEVSQIWPGLNGKVVVNRLRPCAVDSANVTAVNSQGKILVGIADGLRPCPHWDTKLLEVIDDPDKPYMIQTSHGDYLPDTWIVTHAIFTRALYERWGYLAWPEYLHYGVDDDWTLHAQQEGVVLDVRERISLPYYHWSNGKRQMDELTKHAAASGAWEIKDRVLAKRIASRFAGKVKDGCVVLE